MKEGNEVIAKWFGLTIDRATSNGRRLWSIVDLPEFCKQINIPESRIRVFYSEDLEFHTSWDWLMPVASKIFSDGYNDEGFAIVVKIKIAISDVDIIAARTHIIEFIEWHNNQKP
jgi:hypothetical protein